MTEAEGYINKLILVFTIVFLFFSFLSLYYALFSFSEGKEPFLTGRVFGNTSYASVNITIEEVLAINFTIDNIDWGSGRVYGVYATLNTAGGANNVTGGNWTGNTEGFRVENIGNSNITMYLKTEKNASSFISGTGPTYEFNVTNNKTNSCINASGFALGYFHNVNATNSSNLGTRVCDNFQFINDRDVIRIDIKIGIPFDSRIGTLGDIMTATVHPVL